MIIYRIFNKINGKSYICQSLFDFNKRYKGSKWWKYTHNIILKNSIEKYGVDNFEFEILHDDVKDLSELNKLEELYAKKFNSYRPNGYNIRGCGDNKFVDDELKDKLSKFRIGTDYRPSNKKSSIYKGVYWKESKKSWLCRFQNSKIKKDKYTNSEIEAAEMYDKVSLYLIGRNCYLNFEDKRDEYLSSNLEDFYYNTFLKVKTKRKDGYFKDDSELLSQVEPLVWKMSVPEIAKKLNTTPRKISWCIKKNNLNHPGKNYWQNKGKNESFKHLKLYEEFDEVIKWWADILDLFQEYIDDNRMRKVGILTPISDMSIFDYKFIPKSNEVEIIVNSNVPNIKNYISRLKKFGYDTQYEENIKPKIPCINKDYQFTKIIIKRNNLLEN